MKVLEGNLTKNVGVGEKESGKHHVVAGRFIYDAAWDMSLRFPEISRKLARVTGWREPLI